jgi:hypothetical protein
MADQTPYDTPDTEATAPAADVPAAPAAPQLSPNAQRYAQTAMQTGGYSDAQVAGMLGTRAFESGMNPQAANPSSGATGISQDLGSRAEGFAAYAKAAGKDPNDPATQATYDIMEMHGHTPGYTDERNAGANLWNAQTAEQAAASQVHDFERPGAAAEQAEIPTAQRYAEQALPAVAAFRASLGQQTQAAQPNPQARAAAQAFLADDAAPVQAGGQFDHLSVPATVQPNKPAHALDAAQAFLAPDPAEAQGAAVAAQPGTAVSQDTANFGTLSHALTTIPGSLYSGATWLPAHLLDGWNAIQHYYQANPGALMQSQDVAAGGGVQDPQAGVLDPNTGGISKNPHAQADLNLIRSIPGIGPALVGGPQGQGSALAERGAKALGLETRSPPEYGDTSILDNLVAGGANLVGASLQPGGLAREGAAVAGSLADGALNAAGKSALSLLWRHVAEPALLEPGVALAEDVAGRMTSDPRAQAAAQAAAIPVGLGLRGAMLAGVEKAAQVGLAGFSQASSAAQGENLARSALDKAFVGEAGGGPAATPAENATARIAADTAKAAAAAQAGALVRAPDLMFSAEPGQVPGPAAPLPSGTSVPAALQTSSAPLQKMAYNILHRGDEIQNNFVNGDQPRNLAAMNALRPQGDAQDAVQAVQNHQSAAQTIVTQRVALAEAEARMRIGQLSTGATGQQLAEGDVGNEVDLAAETINQLKAARDDSKTMVDDGYAVARAQGQLDATHDTAPLYSALESTLGQAKARGNLPKDIPTAEVASLYKDGNPGGMWDQQGNRNPATMGSQFTAGSNAAFPQQMSIDRALSLETNLGNSYRQEQDKLTAADGSGSRIRLANLAAMQGAVRGWIDKASLLNGNYASLLAARSTAATHHATFETGPVGDLLNQSSLVSPAQAIQKYVGKSQYAGQMADELSKALQFRTGAADAAAQAPGTFDPAAPGMGSAVPGVGGNPGIAPIDQAKNTIADYLHQSYLNSRVAGGKNLGDAWLRNRQPFFEKLQQDPTFSELHGRLMQYQNLMDHQLPQVGAAASDDLDAIQHSAANEFLGGEAGPRLDSVLNGKAPVSGMRQLLGIVKQGGQASYRGFQGMLWDRAYTAGESQSPTTMGSTVSGAAIKQFLARPGVAAAYSLAKADDPAWGDRFDRMVNGAVLQDRLNTAPNVNLPQSVQQATGKGPLADAAEALFRIAATQTLGHKLNVGGGIQVPAIVSSLSGKWFPQISSGLSRVLGRVDPASATRAALRQALQDPEKLRALLAPVQGGPSQQKWAGGISPWLQGLGITAARSMLDPAPSTPNLGQGQVSP